MSNKLGTTLREAPPLPERIEDWHRQNKTERTLNDLVEDIHRALIEDEKIGGRYRGYLRAVYDAHAVEGSLAADNILAAMMIRERAKQTSSEVAEEKLAVINLALGVVLRRYQNSRKQRRNMLGGQEVPENGD